MHLPGRFSRRSQNWISSGTSQFAQEYNYPTLDIDIDRERAGQFGLTMSDVVRLVVPAHVLLPFH